MSKKYQVFAAFQPAEIEREIAAYWKKNKSFEASVNSRNGAPSFVFYEGPPSANGMPGIHHVISRTLKDLVCRYKTMQGFQVNRKGGWDTHGLPIELGVEKELGITKEDIGTKISVEAYNEKCKAAVLRYKDEWDSLTEKMGYWVDLDNPYITFENNYIESLWWLLKKLYDKDLLYESVSIQPYSPAAGTGLSSHELNQPGTYKAVKDTSVVAMFKAINNEKSAFLFEKTQNESIYFLAWTTTPWTLFSNLGLTVGENIDYVLVKTFNPYLHSPINVVLAETLLPKYFNPAGQDADFEGYSAESKILPWKILTKCKGKDLEGIRYEQILPYEANKTNEANAFKLLVGDFVTTEDGTGIVHTAPAFGADDYKVGKKYGIGMLTMVDRAGKFVENLGEFSGRYVKNYKDEPNYTDVNVDIAVHLKKDNKAFKVEKYEHNYPHCWRTDKPILYYPLQAWFIRTTALKERMIEANKNINWKPKSTGEGRFGNWLENMVDWNLSRSRYWGTPLPIWRTEDGDEIKCIGSIAALRSEAEKAEKILSIQQTADLSDAALDLHKPFVDKIILVSANGKPMYRVPDLIDVWFDSGGMPYAQWHFPFENKAIFAQNYPADFIAEGVDQTRGWFYTLHAIGSLIKESIAEELAAAGLPTEKIDGRAYKTVVSNGLVLDKNGNKMSKRLGNVIDPFETIASYGADATRWYLITNTSPWDNLKFDLQGIQEVQRKFFGTLFNTYKFFALYANTEMPTDLEKNFIPIAERPEMDRWIISELHSLIKNVETAMDDYEPTQAGRWIEYFVNDQLSNWYVRLNRRRFWKGEERDKIAAYQTLYECLETVCLLMAPIAPFFSEAIFLNLNEVGQRHKVDSIHQAFFPKANDAYIQADLEEKMALAQAISSLVLSLRKKNNIKVRQPLEKIMIPILNEKMAAQIKAVEPIILSEVNVKSIEYLDENQSIIKKKLKPNFKTLGPKLGGQMKQAAGLIQALSSAAIAQLEKDKSFPLIIDNETFILNIEDVEIIAEDIVGWSVASKDSLTVALDITISPKLLSEGNAREFINKIQNIRKDKNFELSDKITVTILDNSVPPIIKDAINEHITYICGEILADAIHWSNQKDENMISVEINDSLLNIAVNPKV